MPLRWPPADPRACAPAPRQQWVLAHHEPLAGKLGGDLGEVTLVEQRELEGAGIEKSADLQALSAVIQSSPAGISSSRMRALVIMPRSPTSTTRDRPKRCLSLSIWVASVIGSAVLPSNTSTATGPPSAAHNKP
jgi:hypothetical protein